MQQWRWFDGANSEVGSRMTFGALDFDPDWVRDRVRKNGRAALGNWTVRIEDDGYYDDVEVPVVETIPLPELEGLTTAELLQHPRPARQVRPADRQPDG